MVARHQDGRARLRCHPVLSIARLSIGPARCAGAAAMVAPDQTGDQPGAEGVLDGLHLESLKSSDQASLAWMLCKQRAPQHPCDCVRQAPACSSCAPAAPDPPVLESDSSNGTRLVGLGWPGRFTPKQRQPWNSQTQQPSAVQVRPNRLRPTVQESASWIAGMAGDLSHPWCGPRLSQIRTGRSVHWSDQKLIQCLAVKTQAHRLTEAPPC